MNIYRTISQFSKKSLPQLFKPVKQGLKPKQSDAFKQVKSLFTETHKEQVIKDNILDNYDPKTLYKQVDSSIETYFTKRPYNLESFNFLLTVLITQNKQQEFIKALSMMKELNLEYNNLTYVNLVKGYGRFKQIQKSEYYFDTAIQKFGGSVYLFNSLIDAYTKNHMPSKALQAFNDMKQSGIVPNVEVYTSLINGFYRTKDIEKCWELFMEVRQGQSSNIPDENLLGLMIEICASTNDAEKAIGIYNMMDEMEFRESTQVFNAYIKALGSRTDYAEKGVEQFQLMMMKRIPIDSDTIVSALDACSNCGDVKTAFEVIQAMTQNGIKENKYIYNQMIRVYAGACNLSFLDIELRNKYVEDAWKILNQAQEKQMVTTRTLNSMCDLMVNCENLPDLEGLVLPLYDQLQLKKDAYTYQAIIKILHNEKRLLDVFRIFDQVVQVHQPTFQTVCCYIESAMLAADEDRVVSALEWFNKINKLPKFQYLSHLGNLSNLPIRIHALLDEYPRKFGLVKDRIYRSQRGDRHFN